MNLETYLYNALGFALQTLPATVLMLMPFDRVSRHAPAWHTWMVLLATVLGVSALYPLAIDAVMAGSTATGYAGVMQGFGIANLYACLTITALACLFFALVQDRPSRKLFAMFAVIVFAAIQYTLSNVLLDLLPYKTDPTQVYDRRTVAAYLMVTLALFPYAAVFFRIYVRRYLAILDFRHSRPEFAFLLALVAFYLAINAFLASFWSAIRTVMDLSGHYYPLVFLLLTAMLVTVYAYTIRLSVLRSEDEARKLENAIIRESYKNMLAGMQAQKALLHDSRHLLNGLSAVIDGGDLAEIRAYVDEALQRTHSSDDRYCADHRVNGILQFYASIAAASKVPFAVQARVPGLPGLLDTDLTVLLGNALENAIRAARDCRGQDADGAGGIQFTANVTQNLFCVQIENPCAGVRYADPVRAAANPEAFLPGEAFLSTTGGGQGLGRIAAICAKYDGAALYRYDAAGRRFIARITLQIPEDNPAAQDNI